VPVRVSTETERRRPLIADQLRQARAAGLAVGSNWDHLETVAAATAADLHRNRVAVVDWNPGNRTRYRGALSIYRGTAAHRLADDSTTLLSAAFPALQSGGVGLVVDAAGWHTPSYIGEKIGRIFTSCGVAETDVTVIALLLTAISGCYVDHQVDAAPHG
jgi:acyl dehydratase